MQVIPSSATSVVDGGSAKVWVANEAPPVHASASGTAGVPEAPTATQNVVVVQDTLASESVVADGSTVGTIVHLAPSQLSARVTVSEDAFLALPTAMQKLGPTHETAVRPLSVSPAGSAVGTMLHVDPFHFCARVVVAPAAPWAPTAMQKDDSEHDTLEALLLVDAPAVAIGVVDQLVACTCGGTVIGAADAGALATKGMTSARASAGAAMVVVTMAARREPRR